MGHFILSACYNTVSLHTCVYWLQLLYKSIQLLPYFDDRRLNVTCFMLPCPHLTCSSYFPGLLRWIFKSLRSIYLFSIVLFILSHFIASFSGSCSLPSVCLTLEYLYRSKWLPDTSMFVVLLHLLYRRSYELHHQKLFSYQAVTHHFAPQYQWCLLHLHTRTQVLFHLFLVFKKELRLPEFFLF